MAPHDSALAEAVRHIREVALRQVMMMVNRLQPERPDDLGFDEWSERSFTRGHKHARMQAYDEIERMIAREAPVPDAAERDDDGGC